MLRTARRELVADGSSSRDVSGFAEVLGSRFGVFPDRDYVVRSVWLDTFDWRLHRAGLALRQVGRGADGEVVLESVAGEVIASLHAAVQWPALIDSLPESSLRDHLESVVGVRALLPSAEVRARCTVLRLVDAQDKTVVRVTVEDAEVLRPRAVVLALRVGLRALRGYERELDRAVGLLTSVSGLAVAGRGARETALVASGVLPGSYTGKVAVAVDGSAPAARSAAALLLGVTDLIEANVEGVVGDVDVEFLHDLRIGVRQLRSTLKAVAAVLPAELVTSFTDEWRWLGSVSTPVRDLDVFLLGLSGRSEVFDVHGLAGLAPLGDHLNARRRTELRRLRAQLASPRFAGLLNEWRTQLEAVQRQGSGEPFTGEPSTGELAAARLRRAYRRLVRQASAITAQSGVDELHDVRKRGKELRYVLEMFASLYDSGIRRAVIRQLKDLQDCLGAIQDSEVHLDALRAYASGTPAHPVPSDTLLAVGALVDRLQTRDRRARAELEDRVARFAGPKTAALMHAMTRAAQA